MILVCLVDVDDILNEISSSDSDDAEESDEEQKVPDRNEVAKKSDKQAKEPENAKADEGEDDPLAEMQLSDPGDAGGSHEGSDSDDGVEEARKRRSRLLERATKSFAHVQKSKDDDDLMEKGRPSESKEEPIGFSAMLASKSAVNEKAPSAENQSQDQELGADLHKVESAPPAKRTPRSDRLGLKQGGANMFKSFTVGLHNRARPDLIEDDKKKNKDEDEVSDEEKERILRMIE